MNTLEIHSTLTLADWHAYQAAWSLRLQAHSRLSRRSMLMTVLVAVVMAVTLVMLAVYLNRPVSFLAIIIGATAAILGVMINMRRVRAAAQPDEHGIVLGPTRISFDAAGMRVAKAHSDIRHDWSVFQEVTVSATHLFVWIDRVSAVIVPVRDLPGGLPAHQAADVIRALAAAARDRLVDTSAAADSERSPVAHAVPEARASSERTHSGPTSFLRSVGRFLTLRPVESPSLELTDRTLLLLGLLSVALWMLTARITADPDSVFYAYGFIGTGWYALIVALTAVAWARLSDPPVTIRITLAVALMFVPVAIVLAALIIQYSPSALSLGLLIVLATYASMYGHVAIRSLTARPQPLAMFATMLFLALTAWYAQNQYITAQFWYPGDEESTEAAGAQDYMARWQRLEPLLFGQSQFIDDSVAAMERPQDLPAAAFFVGFAGMGEERVFAGEIALASKVIADKFGTAPRSLQLVNDQRDMESQPFASPSALRHALNAVAERMDLEQDVLFLSLSSHGSEDGELMVSNGQIPLNGLDADEVADALAQSGIRWRVVIVSACYAGTFIEPLRDEHTIVITAAAADRTSFGCSDTRDLTYFGEAFYRDALPGAPDLRTAFQRATAAIAQREQAEDIEASNPQAYFGEAIERQLNRLAGTTR